MEPITVSIEDTRTGWAVTAAVGRRTLRRWLAPTETAARALASLAESVYQADHDLLDEWGEAYRVQHVSARA